MGFASLYPSSACYFFYRVAERRVGRSEAETQHLILLIYWFSLYARDDIWVAVGLASLTSYHFVRPTLRSTTYTQHSIPVSG